jgi:hypothetical protein
MARYLESARAFEGYLIMDDTQALGIFGYAPDAEAPYGHGGGGMLRRAGLRTRAAGDQFAGEGFRSSGRGPVGK